jgi:hypothetical protein
MPPFTPDQLKSFYQKAIAASTRQQFGNHDRGSYSLKPDSGLALLRRTAQQRDRSQSRASGPNPRRNPPKAPPAPWPQTQHLLTQLSTFDLRPYPSSF